VLASWASQWDITVHSETKLTRNYLVCRKR
jgi:hypothetical protein